MLKEYQERGLKRLVRARGLGQLQCDSVFWTMVGYCFYELLAVRLPTKDLQMRSQPHWLELLESVDEREERLYEQGMGSRS